MTPSEDWRSRPRAARSAGTATTDVTMLLQGETEDMQVGYHTAFERLAERGALRGYRAFPYRRAVTPGAWEDLWRRVIDHMSDTGSNVLFLQHFHVARAVDPRPWIERVRALPQSPVIATSCGDPFGPVRQPLPVSLRQAASVADVTFTSAMGALADRLERAGAQRVTLLPLSACDVRFGSAASRPQNDPPEFDVVFVGNWHRPRNVTRGIYWSARRRHQYVRRLARRYGSRLAVFGRGWSGLPSWQGPVDVADQLTACRRGRVIVGGYPHSRCEFYCSDRPFIQNLSGVPLVDHRVAGVDALMADGRDWLLADDESAAIAIIDRLLDGRLDAARIGGSGVHAVRERHMTSHRVTLMVQVFDELLDARRTGRRAACPELPYFAPGVSDRVRTAARRGW